MIRLDPLPSFNFYIALIEDADNPLKTAAAVGQAFVLGGFSEASGLESEIQIQEYAAGGINDRVFRFPGRAAYPNITLSRGVGFSEDLYLWHEGFLKGEGKRRNGLIFLANERRVPIKAWTFENGIPVKWSGPALNAASSAAAVEKLEIAHEKLTLTLSPGKALGALAGAIGI
ncbi:phage tail protein (plasmid) [Cereibacter azotoformans]|uniref:Phage tail-like protein n=1 Tax=Cereibacter azotoformans TaxID=43057 RepID=A0A2T5JUN7_9RHOB|nr:phage tail protein [Cereibacter azotoformans]AXQ96269.1 phage tail protein [Cereibacter sphaeroides]PTR13893.1 phage tail-like protein [Cereibacter azotoformans]UIJ33173.1 phage tail protein [Cereibacter azotoformans]